MTSLPVIRHLLDVTPGCDVTSGDVTFCYKNVDDSLPVTSFPLVLEHRFSKKKNLIAKNERGNVGL